MEGHDAAVDLGGHHVVAHGGVDVIGKVDGCCARGEGADVPLRGEDEDLVGEHLHLEPGEKVLRVRLLLRLQQAADPRELLLIALPDARLAGLIFPVRRNAVFRRAVHLPGADLYLEGDGFGTDDRRLERLIAVRLRR